MYSQILTKAWAEKDVVFVVSHCPLKETKENTVNGGEEKHGGGIPEVNAHSSVGDSVGSTSRVNPALVKRFESWLNKGDVVMFRWKLTPSRWRRRWISPAAVSPVQIWSFVFPVITCPLSDTFIIQEAASSLLITTPLRCVSAFKWCLMEQIFVVIYIKAASVIGKFLGKFSWWQSTVPLCKRQLSETLSK